MSTINKKEKFLSQVKKFDKEKLTKTETTVKPTGGRKLVETKEDDGRIVATITEEGPFRYVPALYGYVTDCERDLLVGEILPGFIIGSQDVASDKPTLDKYKVTHIVNAATFCKNSFPDTIEYLNMDVDDYPGFDILPYFDRVFKFIDEARRIGCVFLHCNAGVSRASTFAIGYLIKTEGKSFSEAYDIVKAARPYIEPNPGFTRQLKEYAEQQKEK